jgi:hypothetical protein
MPARERPAAPPNPSPAPARGVPTAAAGGPIALASGLALFVVVAGVALAARWGWAVVPDGRQLRPRPDALEYAAGAQAIAAEGRYLLQVGPYRVRPRYPPGWPLVLALAVRLGVPGEGLWRVSGLFGAGLAGLLALTAAGAVWRLRTARDAEGQRDAGTRRDADIGAIGRPPAVEGWRDPGTGLTSRLRAGTDHRAAAAGALAAGLLAGLGWALAPVAVAAGRVALGDEPAVFVAAVLVIATFYGLGAPGAAGGHRATGWPARLAAAAGGLAFGLLAGMRPASALLFAPAVLILVLHGWRLRARSGGHGGGGGSGSHGATGGRGSSGGTGGQGGQGGSGGSGAALDPSLHDRREWRRRAALWVAGAAVVPLLIAVLLARSGVAPWQWSGYRFWAPRWYADAGSTFNLRYALRGNDDFARGGDDRPIPNLRFYGQILLGLPGLEPASYAGLGWPAAGLVAGGLVFRRRHRLPAAAALLPASAAVLAAHLGFYSFYFFPAPRFLLAPLALPLLGAAVACGLGISATSPARWVRPVSWLAAVAFAGAIVSGFLSFRAQPPAARFPDQDVRAAFAAWLRLPEPRRARTLLPFDPVEAQALGLLPPRVVCRIGAWGELPPTVHVRRLRALGLVPIAAGSGR